MPREPKEGGTPAWLPVLLFVLVLGGGGGLFLAMRAGAAKEKADALKKAEVARADSIAQAQADSVRHAMMSDSLKAAQLAAGVKPGEAAKPADTAPKPASTATASKPATTKAATTAAAEPAAAEPAAPKEHGPFAIQVASFIVEDRATSEKERLATATGLAGQVKSEDGSYLVLLGTFKTRAAAERAAEPLLSKSLVSEASVVALGKP